MICCKIITDYNNTKGNFNQLLKDLTNCGNFLWENNNLYFCNIDDYEVNKKQVIKILKSNGYNQFFINVYNKNNEPSESDAINGWIVDKLIKINYNCYENKSQKLFTDISNGLDLLDKEIDRLRDEKNKLIEEAESNERREQTTNG